MNALYRSPALRETEAAFANQPLMQRAGAVAAQWAVELASDGDLPVLVLAGPGNNGGDALEAARVLRERFLDVRVACVAAPSTMPTDAAAAHARFCAAGGTCLDGIPAESRWGLIIDGLFGIGLSRAPDGVYAEWIAAANQLRARDGCPLLALDAPSGLDADTGRAWQPTIAASHTLTFIAAKPGLHTGAGPDHCGEVRIASLDIPGDSLPPAQGAVVDRQAFAAALQPRSLDSHKGTFGSAGILGGAHTMTGAGFLAGRAALRLGAGRVYLGLAAPDAPAFDPYQPELMLRTPEGVVAAPLTALACGPGLGNSLQANEILEQAIRAEIPLVLDADALNLLSMDPALQTAVSERTAATLLTPHPIEAARLLDCDPAEVHADRIGTATEIAWRYDSLVALKGCGTVIATPKSQWWINTTGNPGLASAGTGDVLTGIVTALLAQGWAPEQALLAGVHLHGAAADDLVSRGIGPIGLTAGELIDAARARFNTWVYGR